MTTIVLIPARGGSKGVPAKNLAIVGDKTLLARTIAAARVSTKVDAIYVSSDAPEILAEARRCGAKGIERPAALSGDTASSESALLHALDTIDPDGTNVRRVVFMQCTSPFTIPADIDGCLECLDAGANSAFTATLSHVFLWRTDAENNVTAVNHNANERLRRQDRPVEVCENGAVYAFDAAGFRAAQHRFFGAVRAHIVPVSRSLEVDGQHDLSLARQQETTAMSAARTLPFVPEHVFFDFDGVLTDNRVHIGPDGAESVTCHRGDGAGIAKIKAAGIDVRIVSAERNPIVHQRGAKLDVEVYSAVVDKAQQLRTFEDVNLERSVFVGNDIADIAAMEISGLGVAPADAHPAVLKVANLVLNQRGGYGAARELCDIILDTLNTKGPR